MQYSNKWLPSAFTFMNLALGFIAMTLLYTENIRASLVLIVLALFVDGIDGRLSRKFNVTSIIGKELDSLSDYLSFGVAPSLFYIVIQAELIWIHYVVILVFLLCGAFQIAKYNTEYPYGSSENIFLGLPINAAGILIAAMGYLGWLPLTFELLTILVISPLMVLEIPYPSFKAHRLKKIFYLTIPVILFALIVIGILPFIKLTFVIFPFVTFLFLSLYVIYGLLNIFISFGSIKRFIDNV